MRNQTKILLLAIFRFGLLSGSLSAIVGSMILNHLQKPPPDDARRIQLDR
jgi:hypothetical protein